MQHCRSLRLTSRVFGSQTRSLRSTSNVPPITQGVTALSIQHTTEPEATRAPVNAARPTESSVGSAPAPRRDYPPPQPTEAEADVRADKGPYPPDGKSRVRLRLSKVEFEQAGSARSPAQEKMRKDLMRDLGFAE